MTEKTYYVEARRNSRGDLQIKYCEDGIPIKEPGDELGRDILETHKGLAQKFRAINLKTRFVGHAS